MNNSYFNPNLINQSGIPGNPIYTPNGPTPNQETAPYSNNSNGIPNIPNIDSMPMSQNYIEGVLKATVRLKIRVFATFPDSGEFRDRIFEGILEASGRDHIVLSIPSNGNWLIIPLIYIDYYEFLESLDKYLARSNY